jgi:chromosome segregation ATPase
MKYRKKPVVIEAIQWDGDTENLPEWFNKEKNKTFWVCTESSLREIEDLEEEKSNLITTKNQIIEERNVLRKKNEELEETVQVLISIQNDLRDEIKKLVERKNGKDIRITHLETELNECKELISTLCDATKRMEREFNENPRDRPRQAAGLGSTR